jgi:hypothetical protein
LILKLFQGQGVLLGGNQSTPVIGKEFLLAQPVGIMESENYVVGIVRSG